MGVLVAAASTLILPFSVKRTGCLATLTLDGKKASSTSAVPTELGPHRHGDPLNASSSEILLQGGEAFTPPPRLTLSQSFRRDFAQARSVPEALCNCADSLITQFLTPAKHHPSVDPQLQLLGSLAPVAETPPTPCPVVGVLPSDLNGAYLRNGPIATHLHPGEGYHIFDGNGMLQSVKMQNGKAIFCARFVKTSRFRQEAEAGRPLFPKFFGGLTGLPGAARIAVMFLRVFCGALDLTEGWGLSNTSVGFFNGQVLSFSEDGMPYVIRVTESGDIATVGQFKLDGTSNMCGHPKIDAETGDMFAFSFKPPSVPAFSFFSVSADGVKSEAVPVPLLDTPLVHDFALTSHYVVFPDNQLLIRPMELIRGESAVTVDYGKMPRFCLLPRSILSGDSSREVQWFDAPGCNSLHYVNAWEEGDEVVVITPVLSPPDRVLDVPADNLTCTLSEIRLNTVTGSTHVRKLCAGNFEFGVLNRNYAGRQCRYVYLASGCYPRLTGLVKVDLQAGSGGKEDAVVARREYGDGCMGGEPFFIARERDRGGQAFGEDDGYLLCHVHNEKVGRSEMLVMDACSPGLDIIASVQLPTRVPSGFHGWFVCQEQLSKQAGGLRNAEGC